LVSAYLDYFAIVSLQAWCSEIFDIQDEGCHEDTAEICVGAECGLAQSCENSWHLPENHTIEEVRVHSCSTVAASGCYSHAAWRRYRHARRMHLLATLLDGLGSSIDHHVSTVLNALYGTTHDKERMDKVLVIGGSIIIFPLDFWTACLPYICQH
jgi:hypothetical protein